MKPQIRITAALREEAAAYCSAMAAWWMDPQTDRCSSPGTDIFSSKACLLGDLAEQATLMEHVDLSTELPLCQLIGVMAGVMAESEAKLHTGWSPAVWGAKFRADAVSFCEAMYRWSLDDMSNTSPLEQATLPMRALSHRLANTCFIRHHATKHWSAAWRDAADLLRIEWT